MVETRQRGFTLIELSIVLVIVALITGMSVVAGLGAIESAKRTATENKLNEIEKALMAFRVAHNRLPCPTDYTSGAEGLESGNCINGSPISKALWLYRDTPYGTTRGRVIEGGIPVDALGLPDDFMNDSWGKRITYTVMQSYTSQNAFRMMHPIEVCGYKVQGGDSITNLRTTNAIYSLVSYGPNSDGAFSSDGVTRYDSGSTNDGEQQNSRFDMDMGGGIYSLLAFFQPLVQQDYALDSADATNTFDDILRYKTRWQMMTDEDVKNFGTYKDVQAVIGMYKAASASTVGAYAKRCDVFALNTSAGTSGALDAATAANTVVFTGITSNNAALITLGTVSTCLPYTISSTTVTVQAALTSCPTITTTTAAALSNNDYLMVAHSATPYVRMWKYSGSAFNLVSLSFDQALAIPLAQPTLVALSYNAEHVFLSDKTWYATVYRRSTANVLSAITAPTGLPSAPEAAAFSKDGRFLAVADGGTLYLWRNSTASPSSFAVVTATDVNGAAMTVTGGSAINAINFSPDGNYIVLGTAGTGKTHVYDVLKLYKIDVPIDGATGDEGTPVFTPVTITSDYSDFTARTTTAAISAVEFTADSSYVIALENASYGSAGAVPTIITLKRQGAISFSYSGPSDSALSTSHTPRSLAVMH